MKVRATNVFGAPIPGVTAKEVDEIGNGALRIRIAAPAHLPRFRIVFTEQFESDDEIALTLLINPSTMIVDLHRPEACLANVLAKLRTIEVGGASLMARLLDQEPFRLRQDRSYLFVQPGLEDELRHSPMFRDAPGSLHEPPSGFQRDGSFKTTADKNAGLQIVLHEREDGTTLGEFDIDLRTGIAHWFEALGNAIAKKKTDPYIVAQLLVEQGIDPGYAFAARS